MELQEQRKIPCVCKPHSWGRSPFLGIFVLPLNSAHAAHAAQAFVIYGKFIVSPMEGCRGTEVELLSAAGPHHAAWAAVTDQGLE